MEIYIISDTHFGHHNIIQHCTRKFESVEEMDSALVENWNATVKVNDLVIHLGDVTLMRVPNKYPKTTDLIRSLNGKVILTPGNHDKKDMLKFYKDTIGWKILQTITAGQVTMRHRPFDLLPKGCKLVLHGHCHGKSNRNNHIDVGVDALLGYKPHLLSELVGEYDLEIIKKVLTTI